MATLSVGRFLKQSRTFNFAHALTGLRFVLTPVFVFAVGVCMNHPTLGRIGWVIGLFVVVCASDYYDGPLARASGRSSEWGKTFDNLADITFLLVTLSYLTYRGVAPWWIPGAVGCAFAQYTLDSWWLSRKAPRMTLVPNSIGHWAGVLNYAGTGVMALHAAVQTWLLVTPLIQALLVLWLAYLLLAMCMRLRFFLRVRAEIVRVQPRC